MIICVYLACFAAAVERRDNPTLAGLPLLLEAAGHLWAVSPDLAEAGLAAGLPLCQAQALYPQARAIPVRLGHYQQAAAELLTALVAFSDQVELAQLQSDLVSDVFIKLNRAKGKTSTKNCR